QVRRDHPRLLRGAHPMTTTKPRKKTAAAKATPKRKPTVIEIDRPLMPSYEVLVDETGVDPAAVYAAYDELRAEIESVFAAIGAVAQVETGHSATAWTDARALRALSADPEPVVHDLDPAEWHDAVTSGLQRLGLTYDELADQASRGQFSSVEARKLWIAIGGAEPPAESTSLLGLLDDMTTVIPLPDLEVDR